MKKNYYTTDAIAIQTSCPKCGIMAGKRCLDTRKPEGRTRYIRKFHIERLEKAESEIYD